eukprot:COSAG04_NODE_18962_length_428_cov_0.917933_2_plen_51_part_01
MASAVLCRRVNSSPAGWGIGSAEFGIGRPSGRRAFIFFPTPGPRGRGAGGG